MGVLDDAIREHIELKRRHGASEDDLVRQEQEALGPARRTEPVVPPAAGEESADTASTFADDELAEGDAREAEETPDAPRGEGARPAEAGDLDAGGAPEQPVAEPHVAVPFEPADEGAGSSPSPEERAEPPEPPPGGGRPASDEDVLDQTPEFLEETPEHDRLWFEQRPPRDFDFDD